MKRLLTFVAGIVTGALGTVGGLLLADWLARPKWGRVR